MTISSGDPQSLEIAALGRPTRVRYQVLALAVVMAVLLYLDRMAISVALPAISRDLNLDLGQAADSVAAFFWCYALCQIPAGWLGDRWGSRRALVLYVVAWSAAMAGIAMAAGLVSLIAMRALLGIGQAGAYATAASMLRRWIPFTWRGLANSAVSLGGRAGGVLAPITTSILMRALAGRGSNEQSWRTVFLGYAGLGLVWAMVFWRTARDRPSQHPRANAAERAMVLEGENEALAEPRGAIPIGALARSRGVQLLAIENFAVNVGWIFIGTLLPTYLITVHGRSEIEAGSAASMTAAAGMAGCLAGGLATDWLVKRAGLVWGRRVPGVLCCGGAAIIYAVCYGLHDPTAIVWALVLASFFGDFALGAMWATCQDIGRAYSGTVLGAANMFGNIGAACAASLIARLAANFGWSSTFLLSACAYSVGAISWALIDPRVPIATAHNEAESTPPSKAD
ncbi:MAG TPA: MFS transporter [Pirellulales bacterium]|nr:MFS transporter [Pirellulales bacterium]